MTVHGENSLDAKVARLDAAFESLAAGQQSIKTDIAEIRDMIGRSTGTNWNAISVGLGMVGMAAALVWTLLSGLSSKVDQHVSMAGHPETLIAVATLTGRTDVNASNIAALQKDIDESVVRQRAIDNRLVRIETFEEISRREPKP